MKVASGPVSKGGKGVCKSVHESYSTGKKLSRGTRIQGLLTKALDVL